MPGNIQVSQCVLSLLERASPRSLIVTPGEVNDGSEEGECWRQDDVQHPFCDNAPDEDNADPRDKLSGRAGNPGEE